jgi:hypothetical protein
MKIGEKVVILLNCWGTWEVIGEGTYLGKETIHCANGRYMWKIKVHKAKFKNGIIVAGDKFQICRPSSRLLSQLQES